MEGVHLSIYTRKEARRKRKDCAGHGHHYGHRKMSSSVPVHAMQNKPDSNHSITHASDLCITSTLPTLRLIYIYL